MTTWVIPWRSRRSRKISWPWSRRRWTQPASRAVDARVGGAQLAAGVGAVGRGEARGGCRSWRGYRIRRTGPTSGRCRLRRRGIDDAGRQARPHAPCPTVRRRPLRAWYEDVLGFTPFAERPGAVLYRTAVGSVFAISRGSVARRGTHTQMAFTVDDIEAEVADLRAAASSSRRTRRRGRRDGIATIGAGRAAWFKDPDRRSSVLRRILQSRRPLAVDRRGSVARSAQRGDAGRDRAEVVGCRPAAAADDRGTGVAHRAPRRPPSSTGSAR